jgi:hypothetical protein
MKGYNSRPLIAGWRRLCTPYRRLGARGAPLATALGRYAAPDAAFCLRKFELGLEVPPPLRPLNVEQIDESPFFDP